MKENFQVFARLAGKQRITILLILTLIAAFSEGAGFMLLVPILAMFVPGNAKPFEPFLPLNFANGETGGATLAILLAVFVGLIAARAWCDYRRQMLAFEVSAAVVDGTRLRSLSALLDADWRALSQMQQSSNRALLLATMDHLSIALDALIRMVRIIAGLAALAVAALLIASWAALALAVLGLVIGLLYSRLRRRARLQGDAVNDSYAVIYRQLEQGLDNLRLIKSFGREAQTLSDVETSFSDLRRAERSHLADGSKARLVVQVLAAIMVAGLAWAAIVQWEMQAAILLPLIALFARAVPQLSALQDARHLYEHHAPSVARSREVIAVAAAAAEGARVDRSEELPLTKNVVLDNVSVAYRPGINALEKISLQLAADEVVAVSGPSGSGKSTFADLLGGLIAPDEGEVRIDNVPLQSSGRLAWRRRVAYVQQEPAVFQGSIRSNLIWGSSDADEAAIEDALQRAHAGFIHDLPGGLDCTVGDRGHQLSGGERQRIALARALLRKPDLLILDEVTSALDASAEQAIMRAVSELRGQIAILIIAHQGAITALAGRTLHLRNGRLTHES